MHSPRTRKYIEAMNSEGEKFDYWKWLKRVEAEEAQAKSAAEIRASGKPNTPEISTLVNTPNAPFASGISAAPVPNRRTASVSKALFRPGHDAKNETSEARLRRRLEKISGAWENFQASRARDAVYGYLDAVFSVVMHYKVRRKTEMLLRHAFKFGGLTFDDGANPFAAVIRCTCDRGLDNKTVSKWARALRYVAYCQVHREELTAFMKEAGGINVCAARYARYYGRRGSEH